jgi:hypothetical protein
MDRTCRDFSPGNFTHSGGVILRMPGAGPQGFSGFVPVAAATCDAL